MAGEYFQIWIVNILMEVVTLGFYRPWSKVRNRQYFYTNTMLEDRNFEYHATGNQLFVAYIIGVVLFLIYTFLDKITTFGWVFLILSFFLLPWLVWRSIKFNARMTSFSDVNFKFTGTFKEAFWIYGALPALLMVFSVAIPLYFFTSMSEGDYEGIALQMYIFIGFICLIASLYIFGVMQKRMNEYRIGNMQYGLSRFSVQFLTKDFLKIVFDSFGISIMIVLGIGIVGSLIMLSVVGVEGVMSMLAGIKQQQDQFTKNVIGVTTAICLMLLAVGAMYMFSYWIAKKREYIFANTMLDKSVRFRSRLTPSRLMYIFITNYIMVSASLGFARPVAKVRLARAKVDNTDITSGVDLDSFIGEKVKKESALGEEIGDVFDIDFDVGF